MVINANFVNIDRIINANFAVVINNINSCKIYYMVVYALDVNWQDYAADQQTKGADLEKAQLVITNGIQVVSLENPVEDIDMAIAPATDK